MEVIYWTLILSLALPCCIMALVQQRSFSKMDKLMLSGDPISNTIAANALQCAFLCSHHTCVGFNTEAVTDDSVSCTHFTTIDETVDSELVSGWKVQTTATPVITTPEPTSPDCSLIITASDAETAVWQTPNYNGVDHYPDEDYSCWLNITIPDTYSMFMVSLTMVSNSSIYMEPGCTKDRLIHYGSDGQQIPSCGDLGGISWSETATFNTPLSFSFKFCSDTSDGGTDIGFKMDIEMKNLMG